MNIGATARVQRALGLVFVALAGAACNTSTEPRASNVAFHLAANAQSAQPLSAGALEITSVRMVVGAAALGNGDQYGCVDCQGSESEQQSDPRLVAVPLDGASVFVTTERVNVGSYSSVEISLETPTSATRATDPAWPAGATIRIAGRFNGTPFVLPLSISGSFRETLSPPVTVPAGTTSDPIAVRITLPVASWFVSNGTPLDPSVASQRAQIEANARAAIQPPESSGGER